MRLKAREIKGFGQDTFFFTRHVFVFFGVSAVFVLRIPVKTRMYSGFSYDGVLKTRSVSFS